MAERIKLSFVEVVSNRRHFKLRCMISDCAIANLCHDMHSEIHLYRRCNLVSNAIRIINTCLMQITRKCALLISTYTILL